MPFITLVILVLISSLAEAAIPATPLMTLYQFNGPRTIPYYEIDSFVRRGASSPAGSLAQGTSVIPCLVIRDGEPLTDARGTPYVGFEVVIDPRTATPASTERFQEVSASRRALKVANHHCDDRARHVLDVRKLYALDKAPFFAEASGAALQRSARGAQSEFDRIVRAFHESRQCGQANARLLGRRDALRRAWEDFMSAEAGRWPKDTLARAMHMDYAMRTALFEGHLDRGCNAYGACERNVILLSIRNRARGSCLTRQGCGFPADFQGVSSAVSQYNIWDELLTQISGLTSCFLRADLAAGTTSRSSFFEKLQGMYEQSLPDAERILYGSEQELRELFPGSALADLTALRHYYHPPAMGKCFPKHERVEYMSGAVARKGRDFALIANTRIQVGGRRDDGYLFREFRFDPLETHDQVSIRDSFPAFVVDARKVSLVPSSGCTPYGTPRGCGFREIGRYRRTPSWLGAGKPLAVTCRVEQRGPLCRDAPRSERVAVGGVCDIEMQPVAWVD